MQSGLHLTRIAGVDIYMDWSLIIIFLLVLLSLGAGVFPAWHPDWNPATNWLTAFFAAVLFFASVLVHELSHALVGRANGIDIRRITLFVFGGMAHLEREPHVWRAELWMAAVGPVTSLILGAIFIFLGSLIAGPVEIDPNQPGEALTALGPVSTLLLWLGPINIILAVFNLVPGFPLDGGRVLRAILWGLTGDLKRATRWASLMGQFFAWLLIAAGVAMILGIRVPIFGTGVVGGLWLAFIGWFLNSAALMSYRQLLVRETLEDVPVARLMRTDIVTVAPEKLLGELVDKYFVLGDQRAFPVVEGERFQGLICLRDVHGVPRDAWPETTVREIMRPADEVFQLSPQEDAADALFDLSRRGVAQMPVVENGRVRGLLRREDVLRWLSLYGEEASAGVKA